MCKYPSLVQLDALTSTPQVHVVLNYLRGAVQVQPPPLSYDVRTGSKVPAIEPNKALQGTAANHKGGSPVAASRSQDDIPATTTAYSESLQLRESVFPVREVVTNGTS